VARRKDAGFAPRRRAPGTYPGTSRRAKRSPRQRTASGGLGCGCYSPRSAAGSHRARSHARTALSMKRRVPLPRSTEGNPAAMRRATVARSTSSKAATPSAVSTRSGTVTGAPRAGPGGTPAKARRAPQAGQPGATKPKSPRPPDQARALMQRVQVAPEGAGAHEHGFRVAGFRGGRAE